MHFRSVVSALTAASIMIVCATPFGCTHRPRLNSSEVTPALLSRNADCHESVRASIQDLGGIEKLQLSKAVFTETSRVLISNLVPGELKGGGGDHFSVDRDRHFLLHIKGEKCLLSLMDNELNLIKTIALEGCECLPAP
ncbi:MAG: hypothetical protein HKM93_03025 [Desulfobacteraceae bacterium]|nr:hypothetical protein [Desulfobacteraceae bacterium]